MSLMTLTAHSQEVSVIEPDSSKIYNIDQVVVTGVRDEIEIRHLPLNLSVVNSEQIESRYEPSLLPLLTEQVPGLFTTARGVMGFGVSTGASGGVKMRGIGGEPSTGMLILIDGHPQYMGLMGHPIADAYQSMMTEKVEVVKGPASMLYGSNAMGGVINILTHKSNKEGFVNKATLGYGSYNTLNSEISSRYKKDGLTVHATGSYNRSDGHRDNMEFEQYGGYAKVGYEFSDRWDLFADVNLTHYNASNPGEVDNPIFDNDSRITRGMASFSLSNSYDKTSGALKLFYNWGHHDIDNGYYTGGEASEYRFDSHDLMFGINWYQTASLFQGNKVTLGFDYQKFGGEAWNLYYSGTETQLADNTEHDIAGYLDFRQSVGGFLTFNAGVRVDNHTKTGTEIIPQFGASIYPMSSGEIKLIASKGFRNPTIKEMYMFGTKNPDLLPEELWSYEISWRQRLLANRLSYDVALYYIKGDNMIQTAMVDGKAMWVNTGEVENWGVEVSTSYMLSRQFTLSANYSFLDMKYKVVAAPEHKLYAGVDFRKDRWSASTGAQYIDGLYTSVVADDMTQESYLLWNMRVGYRVSKCVNLYLKGENLLNQEYEINSGFPMPGATVMGGVNIDF